MIVAPEDLASYLAGDPEQLVTSASALVEAYCGWHVAPVIESTQTFTDCYPHQALWLRSLNVVSISQILVDGVAVPTIDFDGGVGVRRRWHANGLLRGPWSGQVVVTFMHGYDSAPDVSSVILGIASRAQSNPEGAAALQTGQKSIKFSQTGNGTAGGNAMIGSDYSILDSYRIHPHP